MKAKILLQFIVKVKIINQILAFNFFLSWLKNNNYVNCKKYTIIQIFLKVIQKIKPLKQNF